MNKLIINSSIVIFLSIMLMSSGQAKKSIEEVSENKGILGLWEIYDDKIGGVKSKLIFFQEKDGTVFGQVASIHAAGFAVCDLCKGEKRGKAVLGMRVIEGLEKRGKQWEKGTIVNPDDGKSYSISVELLYDGNTLKLKKSSFFAKAYKGSKVLGESLILHRAQSRKSKTKGN